MRRGAKGIFVFVFVILIAAAPLCLQAKSMYVRDWLVITLRSAPDESSSAVATAVTNDRVEVLEEGVGWIKVQAKDDKTGWVPRRFLSAQAPKSLYIKQMEDTIKALQSENMRLKGLTASHTSAGVVSKAAVPNVSLPSESAFGDCITLKQNYDKLQRYSNECSKKIEIVNEENSKLKTSERLTFTFIGALFIIIGIVIGLFIQVIRSNTKKHGYKF